MTILRIGNKQYSVFSSQQSWKNKKLTTDYPCPQPKGRRGLLPTHKTGFTFFEVMVTVAILSFSIVMIFQAFLTSLNAFSYYLTHLQIQSWTNEKIWEVSDELIHEDFSSSKQTSGNFMMGNKNITWSMDVSPIDEKEKFFILSLILSWQEGNRKIKVWRVAYAGI